MMLRIGLTLGRSRVNGPGERFVVWTQGCSLCCPGCFNQDLWSPEGGTAVDIMELARRIHATPSLRGVTVSGGEPLDQPDGVAALLDALEPRLDSVVFTGYAFEEVSADPRKKAVLERTDLLVAGRFEAASACGSPPWAGSSNQTAHRLSGRVRPEEWPDLAVEAHVHPDGSATVTGFPSGGLLRGLKRNRR
ncbi:MAG: radical SAM protein [Elusimicrobia bacterium]|nr:radical SAM protein [Elusimicrobiota bacterium]